MSPTAARPLTVIECELFRLRDEVRNANEIGRLKAINDELVEVVTGLAAGEQVVLEPQSNLSDAARVRVSPASVAPQ